MNKRKHLPTTSAALLISILSMAQPVKPTDNLRIKLDSINTEFMDAFLEKDTNKISDFYDVESVSMPEYHGTLYGKSDILQFFQLWFNATGSNKSEKSIYEVQLLNDYLLETGTFNIDFAKADNDTFLYSGKYMRIWKIGKNENLIIVSEIWGASDYVDRARFPLEENVSSVMIPMFKADKRIIEEVNGRNRIIAELVKNRNGEEHSTLFAIDAVYMPYYRPMLVGIENIRSYFMEHEKPGDVRIDSIQINAGKIIDIGNFVLENGYYRVRWSSNDHITGGVVTGKSLNLWGRDGQGTLMLYRQMVNHD